jgi:hypothetical protein
VLLFSLGMGRFYTSISLSTEAEIGRRRFELVMSWSRLLWKVHCRLLRSLITSYYSVLMGCGKERFNTSHNASIGGETGDSELRLVTPWLPTPWKAYINLTLTRYNFRQLPFPLLRLAGLGCVTCCEVSDVIVRNQVFFKFLFYVSGNMLDFGPWW